MKKFMLGSAALLALATGCGSDDERAATPATFAGAITTVTTALNDFSKLNPASTSLQSVPGTLGLFTTGGFGSDWTAAEKVRLPDRSNTSLSIKDYMGKQLNPAAVGDDGEGREFALNVFGRFENAMMIGCALMSVGAVDATTGYPADGTLTISMTAANLAIMVSKCGMTQADADYMLQTPPLEITSTVAVPADTKYYDKKITMTLPAAMRGATQHFYLRFNATEINIFDAEDGAEFDSRTMVNMDLATNVLKVEYYSGGSGDDANLYFHRLYYDKANDIGKMATYYGGSGNYVSYTLAGKPNSAGSFALSFKSDQAFDFDAQACVNAADGTITTGDGSLTCTVTGTAVADASVLTDAFARLGAAAWVTPSETIANTYTVDTIFTAVAP